jgi:hypothetical protein
MNKFQLIPANEFIWNQSEFVQFLIDNQGSPIEIYTNSEGVCLTAAGVYKLLEQFRYTDVKIITNNLLEKHDKFSVNLSNPFKFFKVQHTNYTHLHTWNQQKLFGCLYNRPLWHRIGLASVLQHDYKDNTLINMRSSIDNIDDRNLFEIDQLFKNHPSSFAKFSKVSTTWPLRLENIDGYTVGNNTTGHTDQLAQFYTDFLIDIVAETWTSGDTFFPTEKTVRPMLLKKPMILMASRNYLCYLRQMGFKTFQTLDSTFWSEDYDGYEGRERYIRILALIDELAKKSKKELEEMYQAMQPILDHNYNVLLTQSYSKTITKITQ